MKKTAPVIEQVAPAPAATFAAPAPLIANMAPEPFAAPAPVTEYVALGPADTYATHLVIEYVAPSPVIEYIARAPAASCSAPSQQFPPAYTMAAVTTGVNLDTTDLVNPQCSVTAVEDSAPQAIHSRSPSDEFAAPVYNQARQELFVAEETTQNKVEIPMVHEPGLCRSFP